MPCRRRWIIHHFNSCCCWNLPPALRGGGQFLTQFPHNNNNNHSTWICATCTLKKNLRKSNLHPRNPLESKVYLFGFAICSVLLFCSCLLLELLQLMFNSHISLRLETKSPTMHQRRGREVGGRGLLNYLRFFDCCLCLCVYSLGRCLA